MQGHGLMSLIGMASPEAKTFVGMAFAIFALGLIGYGGCAFLAAIGQGRFGRLMANGCYFAAFGVFILIIGMVLDKFLSWVLG